MIQFLTRIPVPFRFEATNEDYGKGLIFAPLVGLLIGALLYGINLIFQPFLQLEARIAVIIASYVIITGGLHIDGLGDTFDGVFSNRPREKMLEIMRDSRIGTFGLLAIVMVLFLDFWLMRDAVNKGFIYAILMFPMAGRIGSIVSASISSYARKGEGLGKSFIEYCGAKEFTMGVIFYVIPSVLIGGTIGGVISAITIVTAVAAILYFSNKLGGATGDVLGAVCELNQLFFLLFINFLIR
jgi:cobalamin 5''-phosphate synthase/cobalamin synthase